MCVHFETIDQDNVYSCGLGSALPVAVMSRVVLTTKNELVCSFALTPAMGINGFVPVLTRSTDCGNTWSVPKPVWPSFQGSYSIHASISAAPDGRLFLYGARTQIDEPGEKNWCEHTQGLKQNELIWSLSSDDGHTWTDPIVIPMPIAGSAEAPGVMWATRSGVRLAPYAPYNTFDPDLEVERNQVITLRSTDGGRSWHHSSMHRFEQKDSGGAEAWVVQLTDGRLLGTCWHIDHSDLGQSFPNAYALSLDEGQTWQPTGSTGIFANTTVLAPMSDGRAIFGYVQRQEGTAGIGLAIVRPTESDFGIETNELIFTAATATQTGQAAQDNEWCDFSFGEPSITLMPDQAVLVTYWCIEPDFQGIRSIRLRLKQ